MSIFGNLTTEGLEDKQDRLGGYSVKPTDAYLATIKVAYAMKSKGGAQGIVLVLDVNGQDYTETVYITNRNGENFFRNQQDQNKKIPLPGFATIDDLCIVTTERPLAQQPTEEKVVKIFDYESKKDVPTNVPVLVDLIGKQAIFGIVQQTVNKNEKNESTGEYEPTAESRDENVIEKVFHNPTKLTVVEATSGANEPAFYEAWVGKNKGVTRDRRKNKGGDSGGAQTGRPGGGSSNSAPTSSGGAKTTSSLFGK